MSDLTPETVPTRTEAPDVAELRRRLDALPGFTLKHLHGGPGGESYIGLGDEGGMPLSDSGFDAVLLFAEIAALEVPRLLDRLAHMTEARDNARAEAERLTAMVDAVREWIDRRGVNVDDRDDEYMRGYRAAQRHALMDALELRRALDGEVNQDAQNRP